MIRAHGCRSCAYIDETAFGWPRLCGNERSPRYQDEMDERDGCDYEYERDHCCGTCKWSDENVFTECRNKESDCYGLDVNYFDTCKWQEEGCWIAPRDFEEDE